MRVNRNIFAHTVRVTGEDGSPLGIMPLVQAQTLAWDQDLDLVEVAPQAKPPVCKIMDYGKFRFEESKKKKDQQAKNKPIQSKEIWLRPVSADNDIQTKVAQARKFLDEGRTVLVGVEFKRREMSYRDQGRQIIEKVIQLLANAAKPEAFPKFEGNNFSVRLKPLPKT